MVREHGYSAKTIKSTHDFISSCMEYAVEKEHLEKWGVYSERGYV